MLSPSFSLSVSLLQPTAVSSNNFLWGQRQLPFFHPRSPGLKYLVKRPRGNMSEEVYRVPGADVQKEGNEAGARKGEKSAREEDTIFIVVSR